MKKYLLVQNITKTYKGQIVVDSFSLEADLGEIVCLVGKNGAGKSTILKMIAGITKPTSGTILVDGLSKKTDPIAYTKKVAYMPDDFQLRQPLSVKEFLQFYRTMRQSKISIDFVLEQVGLLHKANERISSLSKGMGQRLMLATMLLSEAKVLLLDEPTNGLDEEWTERFQRIISSFKEEKRTIIFSTHDQKIVEKLANQIIKI